MQTPSLPAEGGCRCGGVRFRVTQAPLITMACHCTGCQKMTASAFSTSVAFPSEGFEVIQGEPVIGGMKHPDLPHYFCPDCMSWMFTRPKALDFMANVRATLFDDTSWYAPFMETCTSEKLDWAETGAPHGFDHFPDMDDMTRLIDAYAEMTGTR